MPFQKTFSLTYVSTASAAVLCAGLLWAQTPAAPAATPPKQDVSPEVSRILTDSAWTKKAKVNINRPSMSDSGMGDLNSGGGGRDRGGSGGSVSSDGGTM